MTTLAFPDTVSAPDLRRLDLTAPAAPVEWLIDGIVARGYVTILAGDGGTGKSLLALQWAASAVHLGRRAAYLDAENGSDVMRRRAAAWSTPPDVFDAHGLDLEAQMETFERLLDRGEYDMVILDSWVSLWDGNETPARSKAFLAALGDLARAYGVGILLLHHTLKGGADYRGPGQIKGEVAGLFLFAKGERQGERVLSCEKMRLAPEPAPITMTFEGSGFRTVATPAEATPRSEARAAGPKPATTAETARLAEAVARLHRDGAITPRDAQRMLGLRSERRWWRR